MLAFWQQKRPWAVYRQKEETWTTRQDPLALIGLKTFLGKERRMFEQCNESLCSSWSGEQFRQVPFSLHLFRHVCAYSECMKYTWTGRSEGSSHFAHREGKLITPFTYYSAVLSCKEYFKFQIEYPFQTLILTAIAFFFFSPAVNAWPVIVTIDYRLLLSNNYTTQCCLYSFHSFN